MKLLLNFQERIGSTKADERSRT